MPRKRAKRKVQQVEAEDKEGDGEDGEEEDKEEDADKMGAEHRVDDIIMSDHPLTVPPVAGTTAPTSTPEEAKSNFTTTQVYPLGSFGSGGYEINLVDYDKGRQTGRPDMDQNWVRWALSLVRVGLAWSARADVTVLVGLLRLLW